MIRSPITHIRYVAQAVPDFRAAVAFYEGIWGLEKVATDAGIAFLAAVGSSEPYVLRLREAPQKHLDLIALAVSDAATVDRLAAEFVAANVPIDRLPTALDTPGGGYGFRFFDPDGRLVEVSADLTPRVARELERGESIPKKLSHIVLNSANVQVTKAFYEQRLGFVLADWLGDFMCFLRVGPDHHVLAITSAPHSSFNHVAWDTRGLDEYMRATGRLVRAGTRPVWGPGRHGPGDNTFSYFVDPNGNVTEYTSGLQQITPAESEAWVPQVWPATEQDNDQWGTGGLIEEFLPYAVNSPDPLLWTPSPV